MELGAQDTGPGAEVKADIYEMFPFFMFQPTAASCKPSYFPIICFYTEAIQYLCVDIPL